MKPTTATRRSRSLPRQPRPRHALRLRARVAGTTLPTPVPNLRGVSLLRAVRIAAALGAKALKRAVSPQVTAKLERRADVAQRKRDLLRAAYGLGGGVA